MMILSLTAGDAAHILTWGGVFVQDVLLPIRGDKPLSQKQHVLALRLAISFVALFAFCFSQVFTQTQYILMWWNVTEAIFAGGAGAAIIGGLYWKRGTTAGAWSGVVVGSSMAIIGIIVPWLKDTFPAAMRQFTTDSRTPQIIDWVIKNFPNGTQVKFIAEVTAIVVYVLVSLLTCRKFHNMDKLLHRGAYAVADDKAGSHSGEKDNRSWVARLLEFSDDFTFSDKIIAGGVFFWSVFLLAIVTFGSIYNLTAKIPWSTETWTNFWFIAGVILPLGIGIFTFVWFTIGATKDIKYFFQRLSTMRRDTEDDGTVRKHGDSGAPGPAGCVNSRKC